jgi:hypothetical protein
LSVDDWIVVFDEYFFLLESGKFGKQDKMSEEIFPTRFKKNPKLTYITCKECGNDVDEEHSTDGLCFDCFKEATYTTIKCSSCGRKFVITNGEYDFFQKKGFDLPKRCKSCREQKKAAPVYEHQTATYTPPSNSGSSSLCYITTAYCEYFNKPDNCYELTVIRNFRDTWLTNQCDGPSLINEYYKIAPLIVAFLDNNDDKDSIYKLIKNSYIDPCIRYIEQNKFFNCKIRYIEMVNFLKELYFGGLYYG